MEKKIVVESLNFAYGNQSVLHDINLQVGQNETVTIIGPNGGGKTTLLRLLAGLLIPQSGSILIDGKPLKQARAQVGYVPQYSHFDPKYPINVFEVVLSGLLRPFGFYSQQDRDRAQKMITQMQLEAVQYKPFHNLSGGQKQRMLIGRALLADSQILLLDEPTSNIDAVSEKKLGSFLKSINSGMTILLVTHDKNFLADISNRVLYVDKNIRELGQDFLAKKVFTCWHEAEYEFLSQQVQA